jgi:hypothetical protein
MDKKENKTEIPCDLDHNGECLICDCWISDCAYQRYLNRDYKYESKEQLEHMFKDYITQGYICPVTKVQCDDECCVSAEDCHIEAGVGILSSGEIKEKTYTIQDFLDMIQEFEEKELPNRNQPYHYEAEIAAGLKHFELFIKGKQLKDNK